MEETFDLLTIALLPGVGSRKVRELSGRAPLADVLDAPAEHEDVLPPAAVESLQSGKARKLAAEEAQRARALGVQIVGRDEPGYPPLLLRSYDPPAVLWVHGRIPDDGGARSVAIVGSRGASAPGRALARRLGEDLGRAGATIVSGLARGIDTAAHQGALDAQGPTVAVLGSAVDRLYPPENADLARAIRAAGGAIVSERPLGTAPAPAFFPSRNRIIAAWSVATIVVEAAARSGALGTMRCALDEGREVMAVPGHPLHELAAGTNQMIRDGAALVRHGTDVLAELGWAAPELPAGADSPDAVLRALRPDRPMGAEAIGLQCGLETPAVLARLTELEIAARVKRLPGALFVLR